MLRKRLGSLYKEIVKLVKFFAVSLNPPKTPIGYMVNRGGGRMIITYVVGNSPEQDIIVSFQKKIGKSDIVDGKLVTAAAQYVIRRGGKRRTVLRITPATARELISVLNTTLADIERKEIIDYGTHALMSSILLQSDVLK